LALSKIPFLSFQYQHDRIRTEVQQAITRVYDKNWFVLGEEVKGFEDEFARYLDVPFCLGVGNGLDALIMALLACGVKPGDEVIVPAHTYIATWLAVSRIGGIPVPVEPDQTTFNIDVKKIAAVITPRSRAVIPVHLYGQACNMTAIDEIARQYSLCIVEDNAQAQGARWREKFTGTYGHCNATSFYPTKNLGALGDAGAITTFDLQKADFVKRYRNYGFERKNEGAEVGMNSRLDEIQASVLRIKLQHLDEWNRARQNIAQQYLEQLQGVGDLILPLSDKEAGHVYHLFVIRTAARSALQEYLAAAGIETMVHYPIPPHLQNTYSR
jgi:dTDP-4-amino-4,6-dideoxygalactose transaminase